MSTPLKYLLNQALKHDFYDANPGGDNTLTQTRAYGRIAYEIHDELRVPPGRYRARLHGNNAGRNLHNGDFGAFTGGAKFHTCRGSWPDLHFENPIVQAYLSNTPSCENLTPKKSTRPASMSR